MEPWLLLVLLVLLVLERLVVVVPERLGPFLVALVAAALPKRLGALFEPTPLLPPLGLAALFEPP